MRCKTIVLLLLQFFYFVQMVQVGYKISTCSPSSRRTRLKVKLVNLLLLSVGVILGTTSGNTGLVIDGLASTEGILQILDLAYIGCRLL
jgi:hypothetical protein